MAIAEAKCSKCGKVHARDELELAFKRPDPVVALSEPQRQSDVKESDDLCSIRSERFFIRAVLPLPVAEWAQPYRVGIWVEVERPTFDRVRELWRDPRQDREPAFEAKLANDIPSLPPTSGLSVRLQLTSPETRPDVLVPASEHPLHREQCIGITAHRASEYSSFFA